MLLCDSVWTCHTLLVCSLPKFNLKKVQEYFKNFQRQSKYHDTLLLWFLGDYVQGFIQSKLSWSLLFFVPYSSFGQLHVREQRLLTKKHGMWGLCLPPLYITTRWNLPWWWHYVILRGWKMFSDSVTKMAVIWVHTFSQYFIVGTLSTVCTVLDWKNELSKAVDILLAGKCVEKFDDT